MDEEFDRSIALALGWELVRPDIYKGPTDRWSTPGGWRGRWSKWHLSPCWRWKPSKAVDQAMLVVDELRGRGIEFRIDTPGDITWRVEALVDGNTVAVYGHPSLPRACCLTCLQALGVPWGGEV